MYRSSRTSNPSKLMCAFVDLDSRRLKLCIASAGQESIALAKKTTGKQKMVLKNGLWVKVQVEEAQPAASKSTGSVLGSRNEFGEKIRTSQPAYEEEEANSRGSNDRGGRDHPRSGRDYESGGRDRSRDRARERDRSRDRSRDRWGMSTRPSSPRPPPTPKTKSSNLVSSP